MKLLRLNCGIDETIWMAVLSFRAGRAPNLLGLASFINCSLRVAFYNWKHNHGRQSLRRRTSAFHRNHHAPCWCQWHTVWPQKSKKTAIQYVAKKLLIFTFWPLCGWTLVCISCQRSFSVTMAIFRWRRSRIFGHCFHSVFFWRTYHSQSDCRFAIRIFRYKHLVCRTCSHAPTHFHIRRISWRFVCVFCCFSLQMVTLLPRYSLNSFDTYGTRLSCTKCETQLHRHVWQQCDFFIIRRALGDGTGAKSKKWQANWIFCAI